MGALRLRRTDARDVYGYAEMLAELASRHLAEPKTSRMSSIPFHSRLPLGPVDRSAQEPDILRSLHPIISLT
jgi:hypothetical protein